MKDFDLCISPVEAYKTPEIPMLGSSDTALLKKLPSRWQRNAKVIACLGAVGVFTLSSGIYSFAQSSTPNATSGQTSYSGYSEADLVIRMHGGGAGSAFYVVHLTEQEAFGIIRARLEAAGFDFSATVPEYTVGNDDGRFWMVGDIGIDLFDEQKNVAVLNISWADSNRPFSVTGRVLAMQVEEAFTEQLHDITVGAFYNPGRSLGGVASWSEEEMPDTPTVQEAVQFAPVLRERLIGQADEFIAFLQLEGILDAPPKIHVMLNGVPVEFDLPPVIINNLTMVSMLPLFEALGMELEHSSDRFEEVRATKNDTSIRISYSRFGDIHTRVPGMWVNDEWVRIDGNPPVVGRNNKVLVSLRFIAEAVGADVEWDAGTRTVVISTNC